MSDDLQVAQLRAFEAVSRLQSYAVAAEQLAYSAPGVYLQVKSLEKALGLRLVRRQRKQVVLTADGEQLMPTVIDLLDRIEVVGQAARALKGRIVVGSGPNTAVSWIMPVVARYQRHFPDHDIEIEAGNGPDLIRYVTQGRVDLAIGGLARDAIPPDEAAMHRLVMVPWADDSWEVFASVGMASRLRAWPAGRPVRVFHYQHWTAASRYPAQIQDFIAGRLDTPVRLVDGGSLELVRGAILNELGLGVLPGSAALFHDERRLVRVCSLGAYGPLRLRLLHRRPHVLAEPVRTFLAYLLRARPRRLAQSGGPLFNASNP